MNTITIPDTMKSTHHDTKKEKMDETLRKVGYLLPRILFAAAWVALLIFLW
jgi:hypothetical protein